jgi:hypothetical protein
MHLCQTYQMQMWDTARDGDGKGNAIAAPQASLQACKIDSSVLNLGNFTSAPILKGHLAQNVP